MLFGVAPSLPNRPADAAGPVQRTGTLRLDDEILDAEPREREVDQVLLQAHLFCCPVKNLREQVAENVLRDLFRRRLPHLR